MYLFTRSRRIDPGDAMKAMGWTLEMTETVRSITGLQVDAWSAVMSPELGTVVWSLWAESMAQIQEAGDKLTADSAYVKATEKGDDYFDGPVTDGLAALVHGTPDPHNAAEYVGVATATALPGQLQAAFAAGIEIAGHVTNVTGDETLFVVNSTGIFGGVAWITPTADIAALDAGEAALMADPGWLPLLDRVGGAYAPGAAQAIFRRVA